MSEDPEDPKFQDDSKMISFREISTRISGRKTMLAFGAFPD